MEKNDEAMLTIMELMEYLRISRSAVNKLMKSTQIPVHRIGRQYRFVKSEIEEWMGEKSDQQGFSTNLDFIMSFRKREKNPEIVSFIHEATRDRYYETACLVLQNSGLLKNVPFEDVEIILQNLSYKHVSFQKGDLVIRRGMPLKGFMVLYKGSLSIPYGTENHVVKPDTFWKENIIGLDCFYTSMKTSYYDVYAKISGKAVWYSFDHLTIYENISKEAIRMLDYNISSYIVEENIRRYKTIEFMKMRNNSFRIVLYLLQKEEAYGGSPFYMESISSVAKHLNISTFSCIENLQKIKEQGILTIEERQVWLHHPQVDEYISE